MSAALMARQARQRAPSAASKGSKGSSKQKHRASHGFLVPCTATASLLLYAQESTILCLHHDTLAVERRFNKHTAHVSLLSVDNVSERGAGRLVVSYDVSQAALVWDLFTGNQLAHFASFEPMKVASWMRNGNVAFGNSKGEVIIFKPSTSEHIAAKTIYDPITALAPLNDCRTYAIGYNNSSILLASLDPAFTILHTLSTTRAPSPIAQLAWHTSSSKQKSDMLAAQSIDGDLRVWSVGKPASNEMPRVIRVLKRGDNPLPGANWMGWSKNGRVLQFSDRETWSWDVRTKHVNYEQIPTIEDVRGIANYGPTATLFTLGPNYSVQQYDVDNPQVVANIQHFPLHGRPDDSMSIPSISASESEEESPLPALDPAYTRSWEYGQDIERTASQNSVSTHTESVSSRTSSLRGVTGRRSDAGQTQRSGTTFSMGTRSYMTKDSYGGGSSLGYPSSFHSPISSRSYRKGSRLRNEVVRSPEENKPMTELLPWVRARLAEVSFKPVPPSDPAKLTADGLRRQMLRVVFGWEEDIEALIRHEIKHHQPGTQSALLLSKWLKNDEDYLAQLMASSGGSANMDWMLLALSGLGGDDRSRKIGQAFAAKKLRKGDIHTAVTILISLGAENEAIEVYLSRKYFMEAILLTCLLLPKDWEKQSFLVRKWGEHVVQNSQQHLALRCFSCAGLDPNVQLSAGPSHIVNYAHQAQDVVPIKSTRSGFSEITSSASTLHSTSIPPSLPPIGEQSTSPNASRPTPSLKLITSFGPPKGEAAFRYPGLKSDDRTPTIMPGVTPIAESAGPGVAPWSSGFAARGSGPSRVATPGGFSRPRLPSIGETPVELHAEMFLPKPLPTPDNSGDDKRRSGEEIVGTVPAPSKEREPLTLLTSAVYDPAREPKKRSTPITAIPGGGANDEAPRSPTFASLDQMSQESFNQMSRKYRPDKLILNWPPVASSTGGSTTRSETPASFATAQLDAASSILSPPSTELSYKTTRSTAQTNRSIDQYINSLDEANYYSKHHRKIRHSKRSVAGSTDFAPSEISDFSAVKSHRHRDRSEDSRGRKHRDRHHATAKQSPSSPIPMAATHLALYTDPVAKPEPSPQERDGSKARSRSQPRRAAKAAEPQTPRHRSESRHRKSKKKPSSKQHSRQHSPDGEEGRGRQRNLSDWGSSSMKSPTSPIPMTPLGGDQRRIEEALRFVNADIARVNQQPKQKTRDGSRTLDRSTSARRGLSPDRRRPKSRQEKHSRSRKNSVTSHNGIDPEAWHRQHIGSTAATPIDILPSVSYEPPTGLGFLQPREPISRPHTANPTPRFVSDERRKELAQAELEARRQSLARRTSAGSVPMSAGHRRSASFGFAEKLKESDGSESSSSATRNARQPGLPPTPRAMRHPSYNSTYGDGGAPQVPDIPDSLVPLADSAQYQSYNPIPRAMSAPIVEPNFQSLTMTGMPTHPAFHSHVPASRSRSRGRLANGESKVSPVSPANARQERPKSNEMPPMLPQLQHLAASNIPPPPILPQLQHLANSNIPPPPILPQLQYLATSNIPPPPPLLPKSMGNANMVNGNGAGTIKIMFDGEDSIVEVPSSVATPMPDKPSSSEPPQTVLRASTYPTSPAHSRKDSKDSMVLSGGESFKGKFRNMTERMRSSSRGRGPRSPPAIEYQDSPYESIPPLPMPQQSEAGMNMI